MVRVKRRYIVVKINGKRKQDSFTDHEMINEITDMVAQLYGDFGVACLKRNFNIKRHDPFNGYAIIQVRKGVHDMVMSCIPLITKLGDKQCQLILIHLSGTIRGSMKRLKKDYLMNLRASIANKMALDSKQKRKIEDTKILMDAD